MRRSIASDTAFSLVEVTLALGIAAFCLIAVFGLMPVGVQTNRNATSQIAGTNILASVAADIRATPKTNPPGNPTTSALYQISIPGNPIITPATIPPRYFAQDGTFSTTIQSGSRYQLNVTFVPNGVGAHNPTYADFKITWPAAASAANASGSVEVFAAFDRN
jgi:Tfp pilus assembly protein PilV